MLIRSQDKTALVKFENVVINLKLPDKLEVICWSLQDTHGNGGYLTLGKYSTKEKALKALDMIQKNYSEYNMMVNIFRSIGIVPIKESEEKSFACIKNDLLNMSVFQMPADEDVKA